MKIVSLFLVTALTALPSVSHASAGSHCSDRERIGDYESASIVSEAVTPRLVELFESLSEVNERAGEDNGYARLLIGATLAKVSLVGHRWIDAVRYGTIARDEAQRLAELEDGDERAGFFLGLYEYYTGIAPFWLRGVGQLVGVDGDPGRGMSLLEEALRNDIALAPEAARVLLEEVRPEDRPRCRYLRLAEDLARYYPRNDRFKWYVERERHSCDGRLALAAADLPRLGQGCAGGR
jgi:hypothetical protein